MVVNNHPSGCSQPEGQDLRVTERMKEGSDLMGILFCDHIIISRDSYFSFQSNGKIGKPELPPDGLGDAQAAVFWLPGQEIEGIMNTGYILSKVGGIYRKGKSMQKKTPDYDNVFKTMKSKHKRMFIPVINDIFGKHYPLDAEVDVLTSEGYLTEGEMSDGSREIEGQISDFLMKIGSEVYLLECQSYDDGSMAIRIAEYAFIVARQFATWDIGHAVIPMPRFSVIYVKRTDKTPKTTTITFTFPDGQSVDYKSANVILEEFTREYIVEKRLFPYIPFYIARYEKAITSEGNIEAAVEDLEYFRNGMVRLHRDGELLDSEIIDLMGFVNTIITHITNGNKNEERLVNIMGGTVIETESEKLIRQGIQQGIQQGMQQGIQQGMQQGIQQGMQQGIQMIIEMGQDIGLDDAAILKRLQDKAGLSREQAVSYLEKYGKQTA